MHVSRSKAVALLVVAALAGSATTAISALAHGNRGHEKQVFRPRVHVILATSLIGSVPADGTIHGVTAGGAPWKLTFGQAALFSNGDVAVALKGLLITGTGTANDNTVGPVTTVQASLYCGADANPVAATTAPVALSPQGNAFIRAKLTLPARCAAPQLLINPNGAAGTFIAASGFPTA